MLSCDAMELPFSRSEFLQVFVEYNQAIWPLQVIARALGGVVLVLLFLDKAWCDRKIAGLLVLFWTIMGIGYHWLFFSAINAAAYLFGGLFLVATLIFSIEGVIRNRIRFRMLWHLQGWLAMALLAYSLVACPIIGLMATHPYPETPLFGVAPCPTVIFTLGLLLLSTHPRPLLLAAVPVFWAAIGGSAAVFLHVPQDWGLFVAAVVWVAAWIGECRASSLRMSL